MATNGLLIEFGAAGTLRDSRQAISTVIERLSQLKKDGKVEEYRMYPIVTGNRSHRVGMIMLECSHDQLEALVQMKDYGELLNTLMTVGTNVTVNRAITLERMLELSKQMTP